MNECIVHNYGLPTLFIQAWLFESMWNIPSLNAYTWDSMLMMIDYKCSLFFMINQNVWSIELLIDLTYNSATMQAVCWIKWCNWLKITHIIWPQMSIYSHIFLLMWSFWILFTSNMSVTLLCSVCMAEHSSDITDWGVRTNYSLSSQGAMYGHLYPASD